MGNPRPRGAGDNAKVGSSPLAHRAKHHASQWPIGHRPNTTAQTCTDPAPLSALAFGKGQQAQGALAPANLCLCRFLGYLQPLLCACRHCNAIVIDYSCSVQIRAARIEVDDQSSPKLNDQALPCLGSALPILRGRAVPSFVADSADGRKVM